MGLPQDALSAGADGPLAPGISRALARERTAAIRDLTYALRLRLPDGADQAITGEIQIGCVLAAPTRLVLDFAEATTRLHAVSCDGRPVPVEVVANHVVIAAGETRAGRNVVTCSFSAGQDAIHRREGVFYTLFVPARAHTCVPCFDQPDLKARVTLELEVPAGWNAVANGAEVERAAMAGEGGAGRELIRFSETPPISTYLMAWAAGSLQVATAKADGRTFRVFHVGTDQARVARNLAAIGALHARALAWLEAYTGIACPFEKVDMLLVPAFQFGGMEHPGAVFYQQASLLLPESATSGELRNRAHLIAHETAHLWFGDLVTMPWFDDVWLKEVFANLMAEKILAAGEPDDAADVRFYLAHYPVAYDVDRTGGATAIRQELDNLASASELYGPIAYQKSPIALRDLERCLGDARFREAVREYLRTHAWGVADWPDLLASCERALGEPLREWSQRWIETAGRPEVPTVNGTWPSPAYGHVGLTGAELDRLGARMSRITDGEERAASWVALWEAVADGALAPERYVRTLLAALPLEEEPLVRSYLLTSLRRAFWQWLPGAVRGALAPAVEETCRHACEGADSHADVREWLRVLCAVTSSAEGVARLHELWRIGAVAGARLVEPDEMALAETLCVLSPERETEILREQMTRTVNPEARALLAYLADALSPEPEVREAMVRRLAAPEARRPEVWALDAVARIHHPLRQVHAVGLIEPCLALLPAVQASGDIFLPRRWAHAVLQGHSSREAAVVVERVLGHAPLSPYQQRLVREAADDLLRVTRSAR